MVASSKVSFDGDRVSNAEGIENRKPEISPIPSKVHKTVGTLKTGSPSMRVSQNYKQGKAVEGAVRRIQAAAWVESKLGISLPRSSDRDFRAALKDGVVLCKLANACYPSSIPQIVENGTGGVYQSMENIGNFLRACRNEANMSADSLFLASELDASDGKEHPRVVNCILALQSLTEAPKTPTWEPAPVIVSPNAQVPAPMCSLVASDSDEGSVEDSAHCPTPTAESDGASPAPRASADGGAAAAEVESLVRRAKEMLSAEGGEGERLDRVLPVIEKLTRALSDSYEERLQAKDMEIRRIRSFRGRSSSRSPERDGATYDVRLGWKVDDSHLIALRQKIEEDAALIQDLESTAGQARRLADTASAEAKEKIARLDAQVDEMRGLAKKYAAVCEENRGLYNEIQDLKGNIRVFCRVRPTIAGHDIAVDGYAGVSNEVLVYDSARPATAPRAFGFDKVFGPESTQGNVYEEVAPLCRTVLDGFNVCIFAYGQTGSGKTFTMSGPKGHGHGEGRGVNYRALEDLFALVDGRGEECDYKLSVQMLEIYNEQIRDLLVPRSAVAAGGDVGAERAGSRLEVRLNQKGGMSVPDATAIEVRTADDVLKLMTGGEKARAVGSTCMNERSSRSHSVVTVRAEGHNRATGARTLGLLQLVDLAGSERVGRSEAEGERLKEAQHINKSLSALGDVMAALQNKTPHVPFRNSKLTQLLADSLGGGAKNLLFIHVAPEEDSKGESTSTLQFGKRVGCIELGKVSKNAESGGAPEAHQLRARAARAEAAAKVKSAELDRCQRRLDHERELRARAEAEIRRLEGELEGERARGEAAGGERERARLLGQLADAERRIALMRGEQAAQAARRSLDSSGGGTTPTGGAAPSPPRPALSPISPADLNARDLRSAVAAGGHLVALTPASASHGVRSHTILDTPSSSAPLGFLTPECAPTVTPPAAGAGPAGASRAGVTPGRGILRPGRTPKTIAAFGARSSKDGSPLGSDHGAGPEAGGVSARGRSKTPEGRAGGGGVGGGGRLRERPSTAPAKRRQEGAVPSGAGRRDRPYSGIAPRIDTGRTRRPSSSAWH